MRQSQEIPVLQGSLFKLKTGLLRSWQKRWFRIEGDKLVYYRDREDLEHLGWIDLSSSQVVKSVAEVEEPWSFALDTREPDARRYILRAVKKEHYSLWIEMLERLTGRFKAEKQVSSMSLKALRQSSQASFRAADAPVEAAPRNKSPRAGDGNDSDDSDGGAGEEFEEHGSHVQALREVHSMLDKIRGQEELLNEIVKRVEKFKQKAFGLEEMLEFKRDSIPEPAKKVNSLMKGYTHIEKLIEKLAATDANNSKKGSAAGSQEAELRMKLMLQRSEAQLSGERRQRRELEERLFRSEVMAMKLNELLSGRDANWIDVNKLWHDCRKAGVDSADFGAWIQNYIVLQKTRQIV